MTLWFSLATSWLSDRATAAAARLATVAGTSATVVTVLTVATAAITVTYSTPSTNTAQVGEVPIIYVAGDDTSPLGDYVTAFSISTNKTYFTATVKGIPEGSVASSSFIKITNQDDAAHGVTLTTSQVSNAFIGAYTIEFYNGTNDLQGTLDLTAGSPSVTLTGMPAGATYTGRLLLTLGSGAGNDNVNVQSSIALTWS